MPGYHLLEHGTPPDGTDRKFDTLVRAIEDLRRVHPAEKFIIFTQYRETLEYLREELGKVYGANAIVTIKGGPLADKIAAVEAFWEPDGAQFLISTSAGGEGINLQCARILFNYDLPWNPMAIEQRIGRIHRYGQQDTAQVYNLVAEDTVEQRIYLLLEGKLLEIARTIGKVDPVTGQATSVRMHCLAHVAYEDGTIRRFLRVADLHPDGSWAAVEEEQEASLLILLRSRFGVTPAPKAAEPLPDWAAAFRTVVSVWESELRAQEGGILSIRFVITGIVYGIPGESEERTPCKNPRREETRTEPRV